MMGRYPHLGTFEIEGPADFAVAREALSATGTLALEDRPFDTLSGGEKQRVIVAAALAQIAAAERDGILLLDEPTVALDLAYQLELGRLLRELQARVPIAIAVSTHDLNFAAGLCLPVLLRGPCAGSGTAVEPATPVAFRVDAGTRHAGITIIVVPVGRASAETG